MNKDLIEQHRFSLLTLNVFGNSLWRPARRLPALRREVDALAVDVVCLQEVQSALAERTFTTGSAAYPHYACETAARHPLGALTTLSHWPITSQHFIRYTNQGALFGPTVMDRMTRKGILCSELAYRGQQVIVLNTHILANYGGNWQRRAQAAQQQWAQLQELANVVRQQPATALVLVAGDFNIPRGCWLYEEFLAQSGLTDPLAGDNRPTYRPFPGVSARFALPLDFVFLRAPAGLSLKMQTALRFTEQVPYVGGGTGYLSDHLGVQVTVEWE